MEHHVDKNLVIQTSIGENDVKFYDVRKEPFDLYGLYNPQSESVFKRLPDEIGKNVNSGVARLYLNTAGGRVRFATDSKYIAVKATLPQFSRLPHMPLISTAGFDLYIDQEGKEMSRFYDCFKPSMDMKDGFESKIVFPDRKWRYVTVNFPSYASVSSLLVGLQKDAKLGHGLRYRDETPVVYYGSSITQGACSSRPGNAYANIISRRTNTDFLNFGFSGSALGEEILADYFSTLKMSVFVADFDHNTSSAKQLEARHLPFYQKFREKALNVPFLMISRPDYHNQRYDENRLRRDVIYETYRYARQHGDNNVYFIDGSSFFRTVNEDMCTVDTTHPNDYGFYLMAEAIESELRWILSR